MGRLGEGEVNALIFDININMSEYIHDTMYSLEKDYFMQLLST